MSQPTVDPALKEKLVLYPDPILRRRAKLVREIDDEVRRRAEEMMEIMYAAAGVGLAAPQAGWGARVVVLNTTGDPEDEGVFINPRIVDSQGEIVDEEGCLSLPGIRAKVIRSARVQVEAYTLDGEEVRLDAEGLAARAWQHEIDHLNGVLIIDHMTPAARLMCRRQLKDLEDDFHARTGAK